MPIVQCRVKNFRAFEDSGLLELPSVAAFVGRNDAGKSCILHALRVFFAPPNRGGLAIQDLHQKDPTRVAEIEVAFDPSRLSTQSVKLDARNAVDLKGTGLTDAGGRLRLRMRLSDKRIESVEALVSDVGDPDLFPLALKDHDALLALLEERALPATKAGKQTNEEKRAALRGAAANIPHIEQWVDVSEHRNAFWQALPEYVYFEDTSNFGITETAVQNQFKGIVDAAVAKVPEALEVERQIRTTIQAEFDKVYGRLRLLTDGVASLRAEPRVAWKKAIDSIGLTWPDPSGIEIPFGQRGAGMRRLFMVAYFQYQAAESMHDPLGPRYTFAIEEPEVHLHPGAQRSLASALNDLSDSGHSVLYTTHSPVFVSSAPLTGITLISRSASSSSATQGATLDLPLLARELGVEASDRLVGKNNVVLVEGPGDEDFYSFLLNELKAAGDVSLDPQSIAFLQCGGIGSLRHTVMARRMDEVGLKWAVISDSDRPHAGAPVHGAVAAVQAALPATCCHMHVLQRSFVENYLCSASVAAVTGVSCVIPHFGKGTDANGVLLPKPQWKLVKDNLLPIAQHMGVAKLKSFATDASGACEWVTMFRDIEKAMFT